MLCLLCYSLVRYLLNIIDTVKITFPLFVWTSPLAGSSKKNVDGRTLPLSDIRSIHGALFELSKKLRQQVRVSHRLTFKLRSVVVRPSMRDRYVSN
jgi:hypothetical protein